MVEEEEEFIGYGTWIGGGVIYSVPLVILLIAFSYLLPMILFLSWMLVIGWVICGGGVYLRYKETHV